MMLAVTIGAIIGVASASSPAGPWQRLGSAIIAPRATDSKECVMRGRLQWCVVANPSAVVHDDDSVTLFYRGNA